LEDEEHKYGVLQRKALSQKAAEGVHTLELSATPIPRTLAMAIHGDRKRIFNIVTKPAGRVPVNTGIAKSMECVYQYLYRDITKYGHQAYVVCPMITANEKVPGVAAVEEVYRNYATVLGNKGISVAVVTGKTKKEDAAQILKDFADNKISVLVSTTVIEVGINVPNATTMVIHNAERFGLAQLHQLRGRVGRGKDPGICVLVSEERDNDRLTALCNHTDGFKIAEIDLELRGAGNFLGTQQSGTEKYLALALANPQEYRKVQEAAKQILDNGMDCGILEKAIADQENNAGGEMVA
jgi:ATP-dependent DNA helicase RecG